MVGGPENCLCKSGKLEFAVGPSLRSREWLTRMPCVSYSYKKLEIENRWDRSEPARSNTGCGRAMHLRPLHRPSLCAPGSSRDKTLDDRHAVQKAQLSAGRNPNKSRVFPWPERNGSRSPPDRSFLPDGNSCNVLGSNNHVPGRTSDLQL